MTEKHLARRAAGRQPHPHRGVLGTRAHLRRTVQRTSPSSIAVPCPPAPTPSNSQTHTGSDLQFFFSFTHQLVHKIFLFYIFYTNVTKRWREWVRQCFCAYKRAGEGRGTGEQNHTVSMETSWEAGLTARGGWSSDFIWGRWRCVVDADCYVTCRGGKGGGKRSRSEFSKERNLMSARRARLAPSRGL